MNSGKAVLGVLARLIERAILGILYPPEKEQNSSKQVFGWGENYVNGVRKMLITQNKVWKNLRTK